MSSTVVGTLVALALLIIVVLAAAEWSRRHRSRRWQGPPPIETRDDSETRADAADRSVRG